MIFTYNGEKKTQLGLYSAISTQRQAPGLDWLVPGRLCMLAHHRMAGALAVDGVYTVQRLPGPLRPGIVGCMACLQCRGQHKDH
jgi:hypothetical protein